MQEDWHAADTTNEKSVPQTFSELSRAFNRAFSAEFDTLPAEAKHHGALLCRYLAVRNFEHEPTRQAAVKALDEFERARRG